jgi:hypothetical protein
MTLLFIDGFDHYGAAQLSDKYEGVGSSTQLSSSYSRFAGGQGWRSYGTGYMLRKTLPANKTTVYVGFAWYRDNNSSLNGGTWGILRFIDESLVTQMLLRPNTSGSFSVICGDGTILGSSAEAVFVNYKWHYIEMKVTISDTVGVVEVRLNGTEIINLTSQDTKNGSDYIKNVQFDGLSPNQYHWWDDIYIDDAQFHGDCRIRTFTPDADGNSSDFTRSTGSNDYECVDESISNEDTDYISSNTLNHKSIFGITTGSLGTVEGIQLNNHCKLDEAGTRKITPIIRSNGTDYSGTETEAIAANYIFYSDIWETDPDDSGAWTQTKLEAAEFGLEITT